MLTKRAGQEAGHFHAVRFYEDSQSLARMVATFVAEGLLDQQPAIIIATSEHRDAIIDKLNAMSFNLNQLKRASDLILLDARDTLASFMVDGMPNAQQFEAAMFGQRAERPGLISHMIRRARRLIAALMGLISAWAFSSHLSASS